MKRGRKEVRKTNNGRKERRSREGGEIGTKEQEIGTEKQRKEGMEE